MIEGISAHEEDFGKFLVIVSHHSWTRRFFGQGEKVVNIFNGTESFLPQLEFNGGVELGETSIQMMLEDLRI